MNEKERNKRLILLINKLIDQNDMDNIELLETLVNNDTIAMKKSFSIFTDKLKSEKDKRKKVDNIIFQLLPKNATNIKISNRSLGYDLGFQNYRVAPTLPEGDWEYIGLSHELTDEQKDRFLEKTTNGSYIDYTSQCAFGGHLTDNLEECYNSLLEKLEVYDRNPFGPEPEMYPYSTHEMRVCDEWKEWNKLEKNVGIYAVLINNKP